MRIGFGYDVHPFATRRKLVLGGEVIPYDKGLNGHSDADVLTHSLIDALLGAAGEGDIGQHFSDDDQQYKDISSLKLLAKTNELLKAKKYRINNIDISIVIEEPRILPHILAMRENISQTLNLPLEKINIKATTSEKMGFVGRKEGVAAYCAVSIEEVNNHGREKR